MACVIHLSALAMPAYTAICDGTLIVKDWINPCDNLVTLDRISGLEWLDLAVTANRSYDDVVANLGVGGDFEGWNLASPAQVYALMKNAGICPPDSNGRDASMLARTAAYNAFLGAQDLGTVTTSRGIVSDLNGAKTQVAYLRVRNSTWEWSTKLCRPFQVNEASEVIGTYLQRAAFSKPYVPAVVGLG